MKKEVVSVIKKSAKVAGVTCIAAGAVALITSGAALKAITEGGKYLAKTVKEIIEEKPEQEKQVEAEEAAAAEEVTFAEEAAPEVKVPAAEETAGNL